MNILLPYSWLKDYIKTELKPAEVAKLLSLHAFSVERIHEAGDNAVFEIEITPNRGDALSVLGMARELKAVLTSQNKEFLQNEEFKWVEAKSPEITFGGPEKLDVKITDAELVPRFSAVVLDNIAVKPSPKLMQERLEMAGIRAINNVVDVTNYAMIGLGQPMHAFDFDKIMGHKMIVRESKADETVVTLDSVSRKLPAGVIVIEDGNGRLIDLCGIMGAENSEVDEKTKKVLLFVQVYDAVRIRKSSMTLGHRTEAALRFEKGIDFEGVLPALNQAVAYLQEYAGAKVASSLIDIVGTVYTPKEVEINYKTINQIAGINIDPKFVRSALSSLGFEIIENIQTPDVAVVPSWRYDDIDLAEDLAEEVVRLYGYFNLPNQIPSGQIPSRTGDKYFKVEEAAKTFLKYQGFFECYNYSTTDSSKVSTEALRLRNSLNSDLEYLRTSLTPQLLEIMNKNKGYSDKIKLFELAPVYLKNGNDLPFQPFMLSAAVKGVSYLDFKGYIDALLNDLGVQNISFEIKAPAKDTFSVELNFDDVVKNSNPVRTYTSLTGFNSIKEDITLLVDSKTQYRDIEKLIKETDSRVEKITFKDLYENALTLSLEFLDRISQLTSEDTKNIRERIVSNLAKELGIKLKI